MFLVYQVVAAVRHCMSEKREQVQSHLRGRGGLQVETISDPFTQGVKILARRRDMEYDSLRVVGIAIAVLPKKKSQETV